MMQQVFVGIAEDVSREELGRREAESTFDRLLREYFAILIISESPAMSDESCWCDPAAGTQGHAKQVLSSLAQNGESLLSAMNVSPQC